MKQHRITDANVYSSIIKITKKLQVLKPGTSKYIEYQSRAHKKIDKLSRFLKSRSKYISVNFLLCIKSMKPNTKVSTLNKIFKSKDLRNAFDLERLKDLAKFNKTSKKF